MALSRVKTWTAEELTSADLNAEFDNILNNATSLISPLTANLAVGGYRFTGLSLGSSASPAIQFTGDTDTGIYSPGANSLCLVVGAIPSVTVAKSATAGGPLAAVTISPTVTEASSDTHPIVSSLAVYSPSITAGAATVTNGATLYISAATSATVTGANYSLFVDAGNARFDGEIFLGDTNQITLTNQLSAAKLLIASQAAGDILYADTTTSWARLAKGTDGQVLTLASSVPSWATPNVYSEGMIYGLTLSNNSGDATNDIDIAAGVASSTETVGTAPTIMSLTTGLTKQLDGAWSVGTNAGGLDTGSIANTTYHVFLIKRVDTGVVDVLFSTSATSPTMPANYTKKRRIGSIIRSAGAILAFQQTNDYFVLDVPVFDINATNPGTSAVTRTLTVPTGIQVLAHLHVVVGGHPSAFVAGLITDLSTTDTTPTTGYRHVLQPVYSGFGLGMIVVKTNTSAQVRSRLDASDANTVLEMTTCGWWDTRGK